MVNVILLLKGFYSMLCASACPFPPRHNPRHNPARPGFLSCSQREGGPGRGNGSLGIGKLSLA